MGRAYASSMVVYTRRTRAVGPIYYLATDFNPLPIRGVGLKPNPMKWAEPMALSY